MNYCKNCKHISFIDKECLLTLEVYTDRVTGKSSNHYNFCSTSRRSDGLCGYSGKNFKPSLLFKFKLKLNRILHYEFFS